MLKKLAIVAAVAFSGIAAHADSYSGHGAVSVTISMSVYVEPSAYAFADFTSNAASACSVSLKRDVSDPASSCQEGNTLYSWQRERHNDDLVLTVSPI